MEFFACIILIAVMYIICKAPEWKANSRTTPSKMKTDWGKMSEDRIINAMSHRDIYKKQCQGGYDVPEKRTNNKDAWEDFKRRHPHGNWS